MSAITLSPTASREIESRLTVACAKHRHHYLPASMEGVVHYNVWRCCGCGWLVWFEK